MSTKSTKTKRINKSSLLLDEDFQSFTKRYEDLLQLTQRSFNESMYHRSKTRLRVSCLLSEKRKIFSMTSDRVSTKYVQMNPEMHK